MSETVQLRDLFTALAQDVGALDAYPAPDGSLLLQFATGDHTSAEKPGGGKHGTGRDAVLAWHPTAAGGRHVHPDLDGSFSCRGLTKNKLARTMQRLAEASDAQRVRRLRPFSLCEGDDPVTLGPRLLEGPLGDYLEEGVTCWGPLVFRRARSLGPAALRLEFEDASSRVVFELLAAEMDATGHAGPVEVQPIEDDRPDSMRRGPGGAVGDYVSYAISRVFAGGRALKRMATVVASQGSDGEDVEVPVSDPRDESPQDAFFIDAKTRGQGTFEAASTLLDSDPGVAVVMFSHPFCLSKMAFVDRDDVAGAMWHRFSALPLTTQHVERISAPDIGELDLVMGEEDKFRAPLREAMARPGTRLVAVLATCVTELIGLDLDGITKQALGDRRVPIVFWHARPHAGSSMSELWTRLLVLADRDVSTIPGTVNLLGLVHDKSDTAAELRAALADVGVRAGALLGPGFHTEAAERFLEAECTMVSTDPLVRAEFDGLREMFPEMPFHDIPPPFGPAGTRAFLERVAGQTTAGSPGAAALDAAWAPYGRAWESLRRRAAVHGAALVVRPSDAHYLGGTGSLYGLDPLALLREVGFRVHVACIPGPEGDPEETAKRLGALVAEAFPGDDGVVVQVPRWGGSVVQVLRSLPISLAFSEFTPDRRILDAGLAAFHPRDFEMGFAGAVRTARRLVRLAEGGFATALAPPARPEENQ